MKEKVYINNNLAYVREDIYLSVVRALEQEQDKNESLRKGIESLKHQVEYYETLLLTKQEAPHYHDEINIISKQ